MLDNVHEHQTVILFRGEMVVCGPKDDSPDQEEEHENISGPLEDDGIIPPDLHQ